MTKEINTILPRELDKTTKNLFDEWGMYIDEVVNFGTHILYWITNSGNLKGDSDLPLIMSFRNILELLDAISILIKKSSIDPAKLQLRALLESTFTIKYILEKDTEFRAMNYLVTHYHEKINLYKKYDQKTQQGKQFRKELERDSIASGMELPDLNYDELVKNLESLLTKTNYLKSDEEYMRTKRIKGKHPKWYELNSGPKSLYELADHLNLVGFYNTLYRFYSKNVHGMDIIDNKLSSDEPGYTNIAQIRYPEHAQSVCQLAITLVLDIQKEIILYYIPSKGKEFGSWYIKNLKKFLDKIKSQDLIRLEKEK